ncbi:alpha/beta hydrolase [Desertivirga brevis]|uniref:alpha/beta hydrolase n=1 Tax=Desertivirga brevis TaxID=2810310 RepID=UPI001A979848|nr:alpha/beta hydrolase [Pedobacter sp. SYSU D00873]
MHKSFVIALFTAIFFNAQSQTLIPLYPGKVPNAVDGPDEEIKNVNNTGQIRYEKVSKPTLEIYLPKKDKATGAAVVIVPGGGYRIVSYSHEGTNIAAEFNKMGIAAFVLKYRLPSDKIMHDKTIGPLQDAQQAIKLVRSRAKEWGIDTAKVGIIGFSAGGHLASTAGTHFTKAVIDNKENINLRPDFMVLVYPVISLSDELMHKGSRDNLIGSSPSQELSNLYSNDTQVSPQTPPTMLIHAGDDKTVKVQNSIKFYEALLKNNVSGEMHIYPKGGHGFGLAPDRTPDWWTDRVENWLKGLGFIKK